LKELMRINRMTTDEDVSLETVKAREKALRVEFLEQKSEWIVKRAKFMECIYKT
jgi:hypothetical protein